MTLAHLKKIRVTVSLTILVLTSWLFLDIFDLIPDSWGNGILFLQLVPSITSFFALTGIAATGFIGVLLLTAVFGRAYCSTICPLGTLQDVIIWTTGRLRKKKHHQRQNDFALLRNGLLAVTILTILSGSLLMVNLLDPFSSFGRLITNLARPVLVFSYNALVSGIERMGLYTLYPVPVKAFTLASYAIPGLIIATLLWMASRHGRLYCNTLCPVGSFLGLLARFSAYRITISREHCISCNLCEQVCKGGCIDKEQKVLDFSRCVGCYNCLTVCPKDGLAFRNAYSKNKDAAAEATDFRRRDIMRHSGLLLAASFGVSDTNVRKVIGTKESTVATARVVPVAPPGAVSIAHFTSLCTACHLCVSACPSQVLTPAFLEYGLAGIMQPKMDFGGGYCNYECIVCSTVCPSGAILPIGTEQRKLTQVGTAKFVKDDCIVYTEEKDCGACSEHCPTKAVKMVPYKKIVAPEVNEDYCIGCGACEHACPTTPYKAIYVNGREVHAVAKKQEVKKIQEKVEEGFPF